VPPLQPPEPDPAGPNAVGARAAAFFDVDNTIIRGASAYHLVRELHRRDFFTVKDIAFFMRHALDYVLGGENAGQMGVVRDRALGIMRGRSVAEIIAIAEEVYDEVLESKIFPGTRALLDDHVAAGHQVWLITASPQEIGKLIAHRLGATGAVGTAAEEKDGIYTGRLVGDMMHGSNKAAAARTIAEREGFDLADCYAYGDSVNDIPILSEVGHPCGINPEPRLRMHCLDAGWPVQDFRRPRSSMRRKVGNTAGTAGAAWAFTVIGRSLLRRNRAGAGV
jgi:HAD superfamily hydrolase (TIGR01490 family)